MKGLLLGFAVGLSAWTAVALPRLVVTGDDVAIRESCEVEIPPGTVIADRAGDGVLRVEADGVEIRFLPGSELRGAPRETPWNELTGIGIRIDGRKGVRVVGARVHGFFNGLVASRADGLEIAGGDFSDNYRQKLKSTPIAEDRSDWLFPHHADSRKWRDQYGGAVCVESSIGVTVREIRVRRGQNGIVLDRVNDSRCFDNDASFLSGWGLAMWRCNRNVVSRNAFDFCVRGHVEGVYNRGQDSAGILCFEQCNENVFAENSATHGGDGFFGFAGREALGELWIEAEKNRLRAVAGKDDVDALVRVPESVIRDFSGRGCNRNLLVGNDFSYAPAHGIEMTFSEGNVFAKNRVVGNAICGLWGGYSSGSLIAENEFVGNGGMAYGLERGAINMEHASHNRIVGNLIRDNRCGIHLWWDNDAALLKSPGVAGNTPGVVGNVVVGNRLELTPEHPFDKLRADEQLVVFQLRDDGQGNVRGNVYGPNTTRYTAPRVRELALSPGCEPPVAGRIETWQLPEYSAFGRTRPVGARAALRGRENIVMDEWGPWDHESTLVRLVATTGGKRTYDVFGTSESPKAEVLRGEVTIRELGEGAGRGSGSVKTSRWQIEGAAGVTPFAVRWKATNGQHEVSGTLVSATWDCRFFAWPKETDPREELEQWRRLSRGANAVQATVSNLDFAYGWGGPKDLKLEHGPHERVPGGDRFGMIAKTRLVLPKGKWRITTWSDDGIRVRIDDRVVLENWTWHGPTRDVAEVERSAEGEVEIEVEHFEIDGYSVLKLDLETSEMPKE